MLVNSAIELYTMLLAWHLYDGFWSILSGTGIGALPFVVVIISTLLDFQEKENVGSKQLVRVLEVRLYTMLFVFFIAVTDFDQNESSTSSASSGAASASVSASGVGFTFAYELEIALSLKTAFLNRSMV